VLAAALATLLLITFFAWQHQKDVNASHGQDTTAAATARAAAVDAAKSFAVDFGSYDYQHLDSEFQEVAGRMTPDFAKSYLETSGKLKHTFEQYKTRVTARVQGFGVTSATSTSAVVVVFLDQTVHTSQSATARIDRNRLEIHLVRTDGTWLVSKLLAK
jgi:Mce-associated membrane protein